MNCNALFVDIINCNYILKCDLNDFYKMNCFLIVGIKIDVNLAHGLMFIE